MLQAEWDKLCAEEEKLNSTLDEGSQIVKVRIENEKLMVIDTVDEAISTIQDLINQMAPKEDSE